MRGVAARSWALANAVMDLTDTDVFVDASKERLRIRYLDRYLPAPPRVIHLVRDVRGVVESTLRRGKRSDPAPAIARDWARTNESIGQQLREIPVDRQLRIRYEDLCRDVDGTLKQAFAFMGVDPEAALEPIGQEQHMLGNQMRLSAPGEVRLDERWREVLPDDLARGDPAGGRADLWPPLSRRLGRWRIVARVARQEIEATDQLPHPSVVLRSATRPRCGCAPGDR